MLDLLRTTDAALTAVLSYDYDRIPDPEDRAAMRQAAIEIKPRLKRAATDILEAGQQLLDVRDRCPHGQWGAWLVTEFALSETMARNWMNAAERFGGKSEKFADLPLAAIYQLSAPSTPEAAVAAIEQRLEDGERVGVAEVKATIAQHKPAPAPAKPRPTFSEGKIRAYREQQPAPAPAPPPPGKLLVDWTDDDWAAHKAEIAAAVLEVADVPAAHVTTTPASGSKVDRLYAAIDTATAWLSNYRNKDGITWRGLSENQVHHANSPCYLAFVAAHPEIEHPKEALASALIALRRLPENHSPAVVRPSSVVSSPAAAVKSDADRHRQTIQTAVEDCQRILSRPAYLDALSHTTRDARREHEMILSGLKYLLKLIEQ